MKKQKERFSLMIIKTLLAILLFTGMGVIVIGGGYIIWEYYKISNNQTNNKIWNSIYKCSEKHPESCDRGCNIDSDCIPSCTYNMGCIRFREEQAGSKAIRCEVVPFSCKCEDNKCEIVEFDEIENITKSQPDTSNWQTYQNEEVGLEFKYQDDDKIVTRGNPNYFCLEKKDINDRCRCYIYINFLHILDEEYHESYKGITYDNLEQYIEYLYSAKRKGHNENDYIVKMERVKNDEDIDILEVIIGNEATDYSRKEYYIDYDDTIYGNYKNGKDYLMISRSAEYLFDDIEKERQSRQFEQIISTFKFID